MLKENLKYRYDDIYRWLVFAEAKNIALLTFMAVILEQLLNDSEKTWIYNTIFFWLICFFCLMLIALSIASFIPFLNNSRFICKLVFETYKKHLTENTIFYTNIFLVDYKSKMSTASEKEKTVEQMICEAEGIAVETLTKFDRDMMEQIKATARIATIKTAFFKWNIEIFACSCLVMAINLLLCA